METGTVDALIVDLLLWIEMRERTYDEVLNAWRTSCPKLPVWEEVNDRGLVAIEVVGGKSMVAVTARGREWQRDFRMCRARTQ